MNNQYFSALANHLWQSTLFAGVIALVAFGFRQNRAAVRSWLWTAASLKFLVPFALLISAGSLFQWRTASPMSQPGVVSVMNGISVPFSPPSSPVLQTAAQPDVQTSRVPYVLFSVWGLGFGVVLFAWIREWKRMRKITRTAVPLPLRIPIAAVSTKARVEPAVVGILHPVLLLPEGISDRLTEKQFEAILAHELCHVRRRDNLVALLHMIVETIFWFHPLVWWIERRLMEERERACDEEVLRLTDDAQTYAEGILNVCKLFAETRVLCMSGVGGSNLRKRIETIMLRPALRELNISRKALLAAVSIAALAGPIVIGIRHSTVLAAQAVQFEVASIKPREFRPGLLGVGFEPGGRLVANQAYLQMLIQAAYDILPAQVEMAPGLPIEPLRTFYDIEARPEANAIPPGRLSRESIKKIELMLQSLLADRFKLKMHIEKKELPVYALVVDKGGLKLKKAPNRNCDLTPSPCRFQGGGPASGFGGDSVTLERLAEGLTNFADRNVVDRTGITDRFDIRIHAWSRGAQTPGTLIDGVPADLSLPSLSSVLQDAGLRLEPRKELMDVYIVDHVEMPSAN